MSLPAVMPPGKSRARESLPQGRGHLRRANSVDTHQHHIELAASARASQASRASGHRGDAHPARPFLCSSLGARAEGCDLHRARLDLPRRSCAGFGGKERLPGVLVIAALGLTARSVVALASGSSGLFVYFLQPSLATALVGGAFLFSVPLGRPLAEKLAHDFVPMPPVVFQRPQGPSAVREDQPALGARQPDQRGRHDHPAPERADRHLPGGENRRVVHSDPGRDPACRRGGSGAACVATAEICQIWAMSKRPAGPLAQVALAAAAA